MNGRVIIGTGDYVCSICSAEDRREYVILTYPDYTIDCICLNCYNEADGDELALWQLGK